MTEAVAKKCPPPGSPAWVMTFADLMSLLMCFFVLLLSFSEMDVMKYKQVAGSMKAAFGVQRLIESKIPPKGTSIIAQEFSPGKPTPTPVAEMRQQTTDDTKENLDFSDTETKSQAEEEVTPSENAKIIKEALKEEINNGMLSVETEQGRTIIRIQEKGSFPSGQAVLTDAFEPIIEKISSVLVKATGHIVVAGHTDNIPIATARYRSNWELSSARAVTVVHKLIEYNQFDQDRFLIEGHADAAPLEPNDTPAGRAANRRVEVTIVESPTAPDTEGT